jgi:WD40 repeat protein
MKSKNKKAIGKKFKYVMLPLLIIIGILAYYQIFYKSERVDSGIAHLEKTFSGHRDIVTSVRFSPGDSTLVTSSVDSTIRIWNKKSGVIVREIRQPSGIAYMDVSRDRKQAVTGSYDSKVRIWNLNDGSLIRELDGHKSTVWTVAFSEDGNKIASGDNNGIIKIWDASSGRLLRNLTGHKRIVWSVKFSRDGSKLASASFDYTFKLWNIADGSLLWDNKEHTETVVDLDFSHHGNMLATTSDDKRIMIWDYEQHKLLRSMKAAEHVQAVAFSPDDTRLMTGGRDKPLIGEFLQNFLGNSEFNKGVSARLWEVKTGKLLQTFARHSNDVMDVAYSHDGKWIATASADNTVDVWEVQK